MELYISSTGILSAAGNNSKDDFLEKAPLYEANSLLCKEPDYTSYIPPMQLRRMSKAVRMGIGASKIALQKAGIEKPGALSVGTALGCLQDTETFLSKMVEQEQMLTPTAFIQSTHNTVGGQIALVNGCNGHNLTYVHRGHSFEHAMINAQLYVSDHVDDSILVGGIDELTTTSLDVMQRFGIYNTETVKPDDILKGTSKGSIAGEGAVFFVANSKSSQKNSLCIKDISTFTANDQALVLEHIDLFLERNALKTGSIDLVMLGLNGDENNDALYNPLQHDIFQNNSQAAFKHVCGEYPTASAFGLGVLLESLQKGLPDFIILNEAPAKLKQMILVSNFLDSWSCWNICATD